MDNNIINKIDKAINLIKRVLAQHERPVVACSFGKNSMIVLHMVRQYFPEICVLFNNTLMEYPETYKFKKLISRKWELNIVETRPLRTFWWVINNYGFPLFSRKGHHDASKNCCRYLKEYPIERVLRKNKFDLYFTGLSMHESRLRRFSAQKYGNYFYSQYFKHWKCHPIQDWTDDDVWEYHNIFNIPHNAVYDKKSPEKFIIRTGCWCCTIPIKYGKIEFLRMNYPYLWKLLLNKGLGKLLLENKIGRHVSSDQVSYLIETEPCYFDRY